MSDATICIRVNGEPLTLPRGSTLSSLLAQRSLAPQAVASARNGEFVPRSARAACTLADGDDIALFMPIVGG